MGRRLGWALLTLALGATAAFVLQFSRDEREPPNEVRSAPEPVWPLASAHPIPLPLAVFPAGRTHRIYLDAGHGAEGNRGNLSSLCEHEEDFTLDLALDLSKRLPRLGPFQVRVSRRPGERVDYRSRVAEAEAWKADVFLSLHSDVRGAAEPWTLGPGKTCPHNLSAPGFSVLWSDEGDARLADRRRGFARALSRALRKTRLLPYAGEHYRLDYAADLEPGVFVDRRPPDDRIFVLRAPSVPSVILETHNALDYREAVRWREEETRQAAAAAIAVAVLSVRFSR